MKNSVIYLGIALAMFININADAKTITDAGSTNLTEVDSFKIKGSATKTFYLSDDGAILNPEALITADYSKNIEDVIAEDMQITESVSTDDGLPAFQGKTIEEIIAADNQIIEAVLPEVQPLGCNVKLPGGFHAPTAPAKL